MTARTFLISGLIAGLLAGLAAFAVAFTVGEPPVESAIALEESGSHAHSHEHSGGASEHHGAEGADGSHEAAPVSRTTQSTWGLATATCVLGTALGGVVGLVSAFAAGRTGRLLPVASTGVVVAAGFVGCTLVPFLKYPPNPPAVGSAATIDARTAQYFSMVLVSVTAAVAAVVLARRLSRTLGAYRGVVLSTAGFVVVVAAAGLLLPSVDEVPRAFPPDLLWDFRIASLATQAAMWATLGAVLCGLVDRAYAREHERRSLREQVGTAL